MDMNSVDFVLPSCLSQMQKWSKQLLPIFFRYAKFRRSSNQVFLTLFTNITYL